MADSNSEQGRYSVRRNVGREAYGRAGNEAREHFAVADVSSVVIQASVKLRSTVIGHPSLDSYLVISTKRSSMLRQVLANIPILYEVRDTLFNYGISFRSTKITLPTLFSAERIYQWRSQFWLWLQKRRMEMRGEMIDENVWECFVQRVGLRGVRDARIVCFASDHAQIILENVARRYWLWNKPCETNLLSGLGGFQLAKRNCSTPHSMHPWWRSPCFATYLA